MKSFCRFLPVLLILSAAWGCGSGPKTYKAGGTVNLDGKPLEGALVSAIYSDGDVATGSTDAQGKFSLNLFNKPGAKPGKAQVTITKIKGGVSSAVPPMDKSAKPDPTAVMDIMKKAQGGKTAPPAAGPQNEVPAKYASPGSSGLEYDIQANSNNDKTFDLTSK